MTKAEAIELLNKLEPLADRATTAYAEALHPIIRDPQMVSVIQRVAENPAELSIMRLTEELSDEDAQRLVHLVFLAVHLLIQQSNAHVEVQKIKQKINAA